MFFFCSSRPCSSSVSHFEIKLTHRCRTNGPSGQHLIMDTRFNVYGMYFETSGEDCTSLKAPLLSHDKVMSFTISTSAYYVKQNKSAVPTSDSWVKIPLGFKYSIYKSPNPYEHRWKSLHKDILIQKLNKCLNVSCLQGRALCKVAVLIQEPHEGPLTYRLPQPSQMYCDS